jgi:hypothetical protein
LVRLRYLKGKPNQLPWQSMSVLESFGQAEKNILLQKTSRGRVSMNAVRCFGSRIAMCLTLAVLVAGCQKPKYQTAAVSGVVTINGMPVEGVTVKFVPQAKIRPSVGFTDAKGNYRAEFTNSQSGVVLGPCVVEFYVYRGDSPRNYLPKEFSEEAGKNPQFNLEVPAEGLIFNYDIPFTGEIPPYVPNQSDVL